MAVTTAMVLAGISAASSIMGGIEQKKAADQQAEYATATANMQAKEQARVSVQQAQAEREQAETARRRQKIGYMKGGVSLEGSPLLIMEQTRLRGQRNAEEILASGAAGSTAARTEGRIAAENYKASGRQAFMEGIGRAAQTGYGAFA